LGGSGHKKPSKKKILLRTDWQKELSSNKMISQSVGSSPLLRKGAYQSHNLGNPGERGEKVTWLRKFLFEAGVDNAGGGKKWYRRRDHKGKAES